MTTLPDWLEQLAAHSVGTLTACVILILLFRWLLRR